jgi:hypothetical protein
MSTAAASKRRGQEERAHRQDRFDEQHAPEQAARVRAPQRHPGAAERPGAQAGQVGGEHEAERDREALEVVDEHADPGHLQGESGESRDEKREQDAEPGIPRPAAAGAGPLLGIDRPLAGQPPEAPEEHAECDVADGGDAHAAAQADPLQEEQRGDERARHGTQGVQAVDRAEAARAALDGVRPAACEHGQRSAHERGGDAEQGERGDPGLASQGVAGQLEQAVEHERIEADPQLEDPVPAQRAARRVGPLAHDHRPQGEAEHERAKDRGGRRRRGAQEQGEAARPDDLVEERGRAREKGRRQEDAGRERVAEPSLAHTWPGRGRPPSDGGRDGWP